MALNRLARAYSELGMLGKARETATKVLKIDPYNNIASKSLSKWKGMKKEDIISSKPSSFVSFLEESGKTKIVPLIRLGPESIISKLDSGDEVFLKPQGHRISVNTQGGKCIGKLPDDLSARIKKLMQHGNKYQVLIKKTGKEFVEVFIRESERGKGVKNIPSFTADKVDYISFTPPELIHDKTEIEIISEE